MICLLCPTLLWQSDGYGFLLPIRKQQTLMAPSDYSKAVTSAPAQEVTIGEIIHSINYLTKTTPTATDFQIEA